MTTYLLHLDVPLPSRHPRQHYLGKSTKLATRLALHSKGQSGSHFIRRAHELGIGYVIAQTWEGDHERKLKQQKNARRLCPVCQGKG